MGANNSPNPNHYYSGETNPVMVNQGNRPINEGDLIYAAANGNYAFDDFTHGASEAADQIALHTVFVGVSTQTVRGNAVLDGSGNVVTAGSPIRVNTTGRHRFIASGAIGQFQLVGPHLNGSNILDAQIVKAVSTAKNAIGRAINSAASGKTVVVQIESTVAGGGPQNAATT